MAGFEPGQDIYGKEGVGAESDDQSSDEDESDEDKITRTVPFKCIGAATVFYGAGGGGKLSPGLKWAVLKLS